MLGKFVLHLLRFGFDYARSTSALVYSHNTHLLIPFFSKLFNVVERIKLDMEEKELESGDAPVTTNVETDPSGQPPKIENDNIEENDPDESGDKEISENEQEKSDHGSEPDAEVE